MSFVEIPSKKGHRLWYRLVNPKDGEDKDWLVIFINGLGLPAQSWNASIEHFQSINKISGVSLLTYDRFGQGQTTSRDPLDDREDREPGYGHDIQDSTRDLTELVQVLSTDKLQGEPRGIILVAASIGAHIARLWTREHSSIVKGILILDSNLGHLEYSDLWPDPHSPAFNHHEVIENDSTLEQYIRATDVLAKMFNSSVKNPESLDRRNIKNLLPSASTPPLLKDGHAPYLSVVGHDPDKFADESFEKLGVPRSLSRKYVNSAWAKYNEELLLLTDKEHALGVSIAQGCGHFIQQDDPKFVAVKLLGLLEICSDNF